MLSNSVKVTNEQGFHMRPAGLFAKEMLQKLNEENISEEQKEILEKAVEIGMDAFGI